VSRPTFVRWVTGKKHLGRDANNPPTCRVEVKNAWSCTSTPQYASPSPTTVAPPSPTHNYKKIYEFKHADAWAPPPYQAYFSCVLRTRLLKVQITKSERTGTGLEMVSVSQKMTIWWRWTVSVVFCYLISRKTDNRGKEKYKIMAADEKQKRQWMRRGRGEKKKKTTAEQTGS
jgi:hypothetical protein